MSSLVNAGYKSNDYKAYLEYQMRLSQYRNSPVTGITSRDDIINPYEIIDFNRYKNTARGQALYEEDLNALLAIQSQQQAAYDEWYNSEQAQVERQRETGLNPDLLGVDSGMAGETTPITDSPIEGLPTAGQTTTNVLSSVSSIVGSVASIAALPSQIGASMAALNLTKSQKTGQDLSNIIAAEGAMFGGISNMVSDAAVSAAQLGQKFDFDKYLSETDFSDVFGTYAPEGSSIESGSYAAAFRRAKQNVQKHRAAAYKTGADATSSQSEFAKVMSDPYVDSDVRIQIAYLEPISIAMRNIESLSQQYELAKLNLKQTYVNGLDGELAAKDFNDRLNASIAKAGYDVNYYEKFQGDEIAALDLAIKKSQSIISGAAAAIKDNYTKIWQNTALPYEQRMAAQYMIMDNVPKKWADWCVAYATASGLTTKVVNSVVDEVDEGLQTLNPGWSNFSGEEGEKILKFGKHLQQWD